MEQINSNGLNNHLCSPMTLRVRNLGRAQQGSSAGLAWACRWVGWDEGASNIFTHVYWWLVGLFVGSLIPWEAVLASSQGGTVPRRQEQKPQSLLEA